MKRALIVLADGFEQTEALTTQDVLLRTHEAEVTLASISKSLVVESSSLLRVQANALLEDLDLNGFDFLILPGGKRGVENLKASKKVIETIRFFKEKGKHVHAICAAPSILGELGYLDDLDYTCFPGFEKGKGHYQDEGAVICQETVTGHSMYYTIAFAEKIVELELGKEALERTYPGTRGIRS
jgi:4-methyl-5(b-hydroxyethyl)-thiazole monophosphate biosynthesis